MTPKEFALLLNSDNKPGKYAWPGGYPIYLWLADGEVVCFECWNKKEFQHEMFQNLRSRFSSLSRPAGFDVYWEGPTIQCCECNTDCESAYGDPEGESKEEDMVDAIFNPGPLDLPVDAIFEHSEDQSGCSYCC